MAAAAADIESLRGKARGGEAWDATESLPGLGDCVIQTNPPDYDAPLHTYRCVFSEADAATADADQKKLESWVSQCLGGLWHLGEVRYPESRSAFFNEKGEPTVQLTNTGSPGTRHEVGLLVYPPEVSIAVKAPAGQAVGLDTPVDIQAKGETARRIFTVIAEALGAKSFAEVEVRGRSTLERQNIPIRDALDAVCAQAACTWSLKTGERGMELWLAAKPPSPST